MSKVNETERMYRDSEDLLAEDEVLDRMNDLIEELEQAQYEICIADPHIRYPDSAIHFGQVIDHMKAIKTFIQARQERDVDDWPLHTLYRHATLSAVLDDEDKIEQLYDEGIGS